MAPDPTTAENLLTSGDREIMAGAVLHLPAPAQPLKWQGEITAANADEVWNIARSYLTNAAEASQPEVIIDLSSVQLRFGSDGTDRKLAQYHGTKLIFQHVQPAVQNVIHLSRMEEFLLGQIRPRR